MANSSYYYNGQQLDTYASGVGVIVGQIEHDSSPEVELSTSPVARGDGNVFHQQRTRAKQILLSGTIVGSDKQDFEQRLDTFKALFQNPQGELKITNYGTVDYRIATFEEGEPWTRGYINSASVDDSAIFDYTNYRIGRRGLIVEASSGSGAKSANMPLTELDLSAFSATDNVKLWAYVPNASLLSSIRLRFENTTGATAKSHTWSSSLTNGWNELEVALSTFTDVGSPTWYGLTNIQLTVTAAGASVATITFDDLRIVTDTDSRLYTVSLDGPISLPREHFNSDWCNFSISLTCPDGMGKSTAPLYSVTTPTTTPQQHVPLYLAGSGQQHIAMRNAAYPLIPSEVRVYDHYADEFGSYEGRYWKPITSMDASETWTGGSADTTNFMVGSQGRLVSATASSTTAARTTFSARDYSALANTEKAKAWVYIDAQANVDNVKLRFYTTYATDYYEGVKNSGIATGWNLVSIQKKSFTSTGTPNWASIVTVEVEVTANGSGTVNATFDDLRWENVLGATGGVFTSVGNVAQVVEKDSYKSVLAFLQESSTLITLTNFTCKDGEIIALIKLAGSAVGAGLVARSSEVTTLGAGDEFIQTTFIAGGSPTTLYDGSLLNIGGTTTISTTGWFWVRLVCKGGIARLYTRSEAVDEWTFNGEGPTRVTAAGYWGFKMLSGKLWCAHVETIEYDTEQSNELRLIGGPFVASTTDGQLSLDTKTFTAREGAKPGRVLGSFPKLNPGVNRVSVLMPGGYIGTTNFHYPTTDAFHTGIAGWSLFGGAAGDKVAIPFSSGSQTYIRRRGSYVYIAKLASSTPVAANMGFRIETDSGGAPSGSLVHANGAGSIASADIPTVITGASDTSNGTVTPVEITWNDEIPITASTTYWLVMTPGGVEAGDYWGVPYQADTTTFRLWDYTGSWALATGAAKGGYMLLQTNFPHASPSSGWNVHVDYTPTHR